MVTNSEYADLLEQDRQQHAAEHLRSVCDTLQHYEMQVSEGANPGDLWTDALAWDLRRCRQILALVIREFLPQEEPAEFLSGQFSDCPIEPQGLAAQGLADFGVDGEK